MKRKLVTIMTALMTGAMLFTAVPVGGGYAASNTAVNGVASTDCYVIETNFDSEKASRLYAGCTFSKNPKIRTNRYSSTGNASDLKLWAIMKVNIPVTTFTLSDGSTVKHEIAEPTSWNSGWVSLSSNKDQATYLDNGESVTYIYGYKTTLSGINNSGSNTETSTLFDSMKVPDTINGKKVTKIKDLHSAVVVKGYIIPDNGYSSVADAYTKGSDTATESGNTIRDDDASDIENQDEIDRLRDVVSAKEKVITALETRIEAQKPIGNAKAEHVLAGKSFSNSESLGVIGTMPDYGQSYNEKTTGYQASLPSGTGLARNSDGTITIKAGYHSEQTLNDAHQSYTVRFNANGGSGTMADQKIANGTGTKLTKNSYTRTGYSFSGWNTAADGSGTGYADQEEISHSGIHDLILYAQWKPITYYVAFNGNGSAYGVMSTQKFTYDEAQPLSENSFEKDGYELSGWSDSANGSVKYSDMEAVINLTATNKATVALYAIWAATGNAADNHIDNTSHTHVWITKYDSTYHWEECSVCATKRNVKPHTFTETSIQQDPSHPCKYENHYFRTCSCGYSESYKKYYCTPNGTWLSAGAARHVHYQCCTKCGSWTGSGYCVDANGKEISCKNPGTCVKCGQVITANDHHIIHGVCRYCDKCFYTIDVKSLTYDNNDHATLVFDGYTQNGFAWTAALTPNAFSSWQFACYSAAAASYKKLNANTYEFTIVFTLDHNKARRTTLYVGDDYNCTVNGYPAYEEDAISGSVYIQSDRQGPSNIAVTQTPQKTSNGWTAATQFTVSGNDYGGSQNVIVQLINPSGSEVYRGTPLVNNNSFSYTFTPNIEAYGSQNYTVRVTDNCNNSTNKSITVTNVDSKLPSMTNTVNYSGQWAKSRTFTITATDSGSGNVKIGINRLSDMTAGTKNGTTYTKTYTFSGDKYDEEQWLVFLEDAAGNLNQVAINIGHLDNTPPVVSATISGNAVTVSCSDYNTTLKRNGSGVTKIGYCSSKNGTVTWQDASNKTLQLSGSGTYYIYAKDAAGNLSKPYAIYK